MRDFLVFLLVLAVVFFGVGEWRGWYLGVPSQTPVLVYKKDFVASATRRTRNTDRLPLALDGTVRNGSVTVRVFYHRPESYQSGRSGSKERAVFEQTFGKGERIFLDDVLEEGQGVYRVELAFDDATGVFRLDLPTNVEL